MVQIVFCCEDANNLYQLVSSTHQNCLRFNSLDEAIEQAATGSVLLILADEYPKATLQIDASIMQRLKDKQFRVYIEYPAELDGVQLGEPTGTKFERLVVTGDFFDPEMSDMEILTQHGCWYLPAQVENSYLSVAKVAGYRKAVFGLPEQSSPVLFPSDDGQMLISLTKLSQFITARYAPKSSWQAVWRKILHWLTGLEFQLDYKSTVNVKFGPNEALAENAEQQAFKHGLKWYRNHAIFRVDLNMGAIEGFESIIDHKGRQFQRNLTRGDCSAETAMVFACDWALRGDPDSKRIAGYILDYIWHTPDFAWQDPSHPMYGQIRWYERGTKQYGDDNARVIMPTWLAGRLLNDTRWDEPSLRCLLANLRTTGPMGCRLEAFYDPSSFSDGKGWKHYWDKELIHLSPHFQCYLWANFLWGHSLTGFEHLLKRTVKAIRITMEAYPDKIEWTNGLTQEICRLVLTLAYLVKVDDKPEYRQWLDKVVNDLLALTQPCGAIIEKLGDPKYGKYAPPTSNESYGTDEASLIQQDGDPVCDLLYSYGFALIGIHEAACITGSEKYRQLEDRMVDFLCRIQIQSKDHPYLDGTWMRAFDFSLWEYYGSNADLGWGAWCVESGWYQAWIMAVLAMRQLNVSMFDVGMKDRFAPIAPGLIEAMFDPAVTGIAAPEGSRPVAE